MLSKIRAFFSRPIGHQLIDLEYVLLLVWNAGIRRRKLVVIERMNEGIGDQVCLLASLPALRRRDPDAWLILFVPARVRDLVALSRLADVVIPRRSFFGWMYARLLPADLAQKPTLPDELPDLRLRARIHLAEEFAQSLGVQADLDAVRFRVPPQARRRVRRLLRQVNPGLPLVVAQTGPTWPVKEWPGDRWQAWAREMKAGGEICLIQIGTDEDSWSLQHRRGVRIETAIDWVNHLSLVETLALLAEADVFVGPDSAPLHLASTLGTNCVGLFGPTEGKFFLHPRAHSVILSSTIDCIGCHFASGPIRHWRTGCPRDIQCMKDISATAVREATLQLLLS